MVSSNMSHDALAGLRLEPGRTERVAETVMCARERTLAERRSLGTPTLLAGVPFL